MASAEQTFKVSRPLPSDSTLVVTMHLTRMWYVRLHAGIWLMKAAAVLLGCGIRFDNPELEETLGYRDDTDE